MASPRSGNGSGPDKTPVQSRRTENTTSHWREESDPGLKTRVTSREELGLDSGPGQDILVIIYTGSAHLLGKRYVLADEPVTIGRGSDNVIVLDNDAVSRRHARIEKRGRAYYIVDLDSTNGTYVNGEAIRECRLRRSDQIKIGDTILKYLAGTDVEAQYHETIYRMTIMDALTGIYNKRFLMETLEREIRRAQRHERPLSLLMFDLDHFKRINDHYGHLAGDHVLREVAQLVRVRVRPDDTVARYGGEEFAVVLPETSVEGARTLAEKIRVAVEQSPIVFEDETIPVTISVGVAGYQSPWDTLQFIKAADEHLYEAKRAGRNRVCG